MSTTNTHQSPLKWNSAFAVWWSFMWRAMIYGMLLGALLGGIAGFFAGTPERGALFGGIAGYIGTIPASMLALKQALTKHLAALAALANVQQ